MKSPENYGQKKLDRIDPYQTLTTQFEELIFSLKNELSKIKAVNALVLFGSFARGDYSFRHSDMDVMIFLDKIEKDGKLEEELRKKVIQLNLGKKISVHTVFQYRKIEEEDKSLMLTIGREGRIIFARKSLVISNNLMGLKEYHLIRFDAANINPVNKNKLQRFLYGYKIKGNRYSGIIDDEKVISAGKGAILIPHELVQKVLLFSQQIGIKAVQKGKFYR
ncbi:nucleotidyltransferase domain-containing protein [Candidatus Woesearchaeota archaeon]|nr:nucleotidyltransferase domain-containing protein [Candidatus Woesearchaeota archaeon]